MADGGFLSRKRGRRSLNQSLNDIVSSSSEVILSDKITLYGLLRVPWKVHYTSLVMDKDRVELNEKNCLAITKMISMECKKEAKINVLLTQCSGIQFDSTSPKSVLVEVSFGDQMVYTGYFLNWLTSSDVPGQLEKLPILLVKAKKDITKVVHTALVKAFDFIIMPIILNPPQLAMLFAHFVSCADKEEEKSASLKFSVPGAPRNSFITPSIRVKDLCVVFDFYVSITEDEEELIILFYEKILAHIRNSYHLDLSKAKLNQVCLPEAMISDTGIFQAKNEDVLSSALSVLSKFFELNEPPPPPPLSFFSDES